MDRERFCCSQSWMQVTCLWLSRVFWSRLHSITRSSCLQQKRRGLGSSQSYFSDTMTMLYPKDQFPPEVATLYHTLFCSFHYTRATPLFPVSFPDPAQLSTACNKVTGSLIYLVSFSSCESSFNCKHSSLISRSVE